MSQPKLHWSAYLWPGFAQAWLRGSWVGLLLAVGFTALANVLLAATLVWHEWLPPRARGIGLASLAIIWGLSWIDARADWRRMLSEWSDGETGGGDPNARSDQWFREAQLAYLSGDWVSAERMLLKLLRHDAGDVESRLMLATLWQHEGRHAEASQELARLERLEAAAPWQFEIAREREQICAACVGTEQQDASRARTVEPGGDPAPSWSRSAEDSALPAESDTTTAATNRRMAA